MLACDPEIFMLKLHAIHILRRNDDNPEEF